MGGYGSRGHAVRQVSDATPVGCASSLPSGSASVAYGARRILSVGVVGIRSESLRSAAGEKESPPRNKRTIDVVTGVTGGLLGRPPSPPANVVATRTKSIRTHGAYHYTAGPGNYAQRPTAAKPARRRNRSKKHFAGGVGPYALVPPAERTGCPVAGSCSFLRFGGVRCVVRCRLGAFFGPFRFVSVCLSFRRCSFFVAVARCSSLVVAWFVAAAVAPSCGLLAGFVASCSSWRLRACGSACRVRAVWRRFLLLVVAPFLGARVASSALLLALRVLAAGRPFGRPVFAKIAHSRKNTRRAEKKGAAADYGVERKNPRRRPPKKNNRQKATKQIK